MQQIISVHHLSKQFKNIVVVNDLSFTVNEGDVYGFLGQNGAGKSTTIRMLLTLIQPTNGDIELFGLNLQKHRREILQNVGAVIEKPDVYEYLSARENLEIFGRLSGIKISKNKIDEQLQLVGLAERAKDKVKEFSQGMKQRLGIAIALIHNPALIILDEPTNGLDPQGIADIRNLILHLSRERKKTVMISSHLLTEIEQIATRLLIIDNGKKMVEGFATELFDASQKHITLETEDNADALAKINNAAWKEYLLSQNNNHIFLKIPQNILPDFHLWLVQQQIRIISLEKKHSLEDYFLQITSGSQHVDAYSN